MARGKKAESATTNKQASEKIRRYGRVRKRVSERERELLLGEES